MRMWMNSLKRSWRTGRSASDAKGLNAGLGTYVAAGQHGRHRSHRAGGQHGESKRYINETLMGSRNRPAADGAATFDIDDVDIGILQKATACAGVSTIGSPGPLNDVFIKTGTPVSRSNA